MFIGAGGPNLGPSRWGDLSHQQAAEEDAQQVVLYAVRVFEERHPRTQPVLFGSTVANCFLPECFSPHLSSTTDVDVLLRSEHSELTACTEDYVTMQEFFAVLNEVAQTVKIVRPPYCRNESVPAFTCDLKLGSTGWYTMHVTAFGRKHAMDITIVPKTQFDAMQQVFPRNTLAVNFHFMSGEFVPPSNPVVFTCASFPELCHRSLCLALGSGVRLADGMSAPKTMSRKACKAIQRYVRLYLLGLVRHKPRMWSFNPVESMEALRRTMPEFTAYANGVLFPTFTSSFAMIEVLQHRDTGSVMGMAVVFEPIAHGAGLVLGVGASIGASLWKTIEKDMGPLMDTYKDTMEAIVDAGDDWLAKNREEVVKVSKEWASSAPVVAKRTKLVKKELSVCTGVAACGVAGTCTLMVQNGVAETAIVPTRSMQKRLRKKQEEVERNVRHLHGARNALLQSMDVFTERVCTAMDGHTKRLGNVVLQAKSASSKMANVHKRVIIRSCQVLSEVRSTIDANQATVLQEFKSITRQLKTILTDMKTNYEHCFGRFLGFDGSGKHSGLDGSTLKPPKVVQNTSFRILKQWMQIDVLPVSFLTTPFLESRYGEGGKVVEWSPGQQMDHIRDAVAHIIRTHTSCAKPHGHEEKVDKSEDGKSFPGKYFLCLDGSVCETPKEMTRLYWLAHNIVVGVMAVVKDLVCGEAAYTLASERTEEEVNMARGFMSLFDSIYASLVEVRDVGMLRMFTCWTSCTTATCKKITDAMVYLHSSLVKEIEAGSSQKGLGVKKRR